MTELMLTKQTQAAVTDLISPSNIWTRSLNRTPGDAAAPDRKCKPPASIPLKQVIGRTQDVDVSNRNIPLLYKMTYWQVAWLNNEIPHTLTPMSKTLLHF